MNRKYRAVVLDLDGVVWRGSKLLWQNISAIKMLEEAGIKTIYLSNNATKSRVEYRDVLERLGLKTTLKSIVNSAYAVAVYVKDNGGKRVFIVGEAGLFYEASLAGLLPVTVGSPADYVIAAMDRFTTYNKLAYACRLIRDGAGFAAANTDKTYPVEDGLDPGAGSIVSFLEACSDRKPDIVAGKPNPWILELALKQNGLSRNEVLIVGDRLDTDIMLGVNTGVDSLLVLTGISRVEDVEKYGVNPTYIAKDLLEFINSYPELFGL